MKVLQTAFDTVNAFKFTGGIAVLGAVWVLIFGFPNGAYVWFGCVYFALMLQLWLVEKGIAQEHVYVPEWIYGEGPPYKRLYQGVNPLAYVSFWAGIGVMDVGLHWHIQPLVLVGTAVATLLFGQRTFFTRALGPTDKLTGLLFTATFGSVFLLSLLGLL